MTTFTDGPARLHGQQTLQCICTVVESGDLLSPRPIGKVILSMHVTSPVLGAFALLAFSDAALALDTWSETVERGLPVLTLQTEAGGLRLICDPDRVFGPTSNGGVAVDFPKDADPSMIVFLAKSGEQARLPVKSGLAAQSAVQPAEWAKMVEILRNGGAFAVVTSLDSLTIETAPMPELSCD